MNQFHFTCKPLFAQASWKTGAVAGLAGARLAKYGMISPWLNDAPVGALGRRSHRMRRRQDEKTGSRIRPRRLSRLLAGLLILLALTAQSVQAAEVLPAVTYQPPMQAEVSASSAIVLDTARMRRLYAKNADGRLAIPAASKMMTALLACERLPLDTQVTISSVAAQEAKREATGDGLELKTGDKYPLEYLLLRLVFYDSNAAALAIAEQISGVEANFVDLMNSKAASLELSGTVFVNSTGNLVYEDGPIDPGDRSDQSDNIAVDPLPRQYSTVSDLARLTAFAMNNQKFADIVRKDSEYLLLDGKTLVPMRNRLQSVWRMSENRITGAFYSERRERGYSVAIGRINDFSVIMVTANGNPGKRSTDLLALTAAIANNYVQEALVTAGEVFSGYREETVDGEPFGLVFRRTVLYIRPIDDAFLMQEVQYRSYGPHHRPIESTMTIGQVVFQLKDGTVIAVDVGPDRQILSSITVLNQLLASLQNNPNLFYVIMACGSLLVLVMAIHVFERLSRLIRLLRLIRLERRARRI
jgi:D-alanyl-D-alanine carboxypeptidase